jgi:hypothetical protein
LTRGVARRDDEAGVAEKNRVDVQTQRDRKLKGGRVTWMEAEAKGLEMVATKLRTQAEIKEVAIKDEEAAREASGHELSEVRASPFLFICFTLADISPSLKLY